MSKNDRREQNFDARSHSIHNPNHDEIALRAYAIYHSKGRTDGHCHENWYQAERELREHFDPHS